MKLTELKNIRALPDWQISNLLDPQPSPERELIVAIIERAVRDAVGKYRPKAGERCPKRTAITWLKLDAKIHEADINKAKAFSFEWCAQQLNYCPIALKKKILNNLHTISLDVERRSNASRQWQQYKKSGLT